MKRSFFNLCLSASICGFLNTANAAPPAVTFVHPAGAQRGTSVEITASGTLDAKALLAASDKALSLEPAKTAGKFKLTVSREAIPGTYWLRAHNADGASALRPFIVGTLPDVTEQEPNDDYRKAQAIERAAVVMNGKLEKSGDVDCYAVKLKKGETLVASLEAHHTLRSPMDGMLQVLSTDGFVLEENNDYRGLDPQVAFTAKSDGTYVVRVYAFPATPDSSIRYFGSDACVYRLTLTTGAFADFAFPPATCPEDPMRPAINLRGWNIGNDPFVIRALGAEPLAVIFDDDLATVVRVPREPHRVFTKADQPLAPPFSFGGALTAKRGEARVPLAGKKGQVFGFEVRSRAFDLTVNPVVRLLDKDGKQLTRAEPAKLNGDTTIPMFVLPADGEYTVAVSDLYNGGGTARDCFLLRVLSEPDYELNVTADRFTVVPGKPTLVPVTVSRFRAFADAVEVSADGLPEGVKAEVVKDAKQPSVITLSLTAEKPVSGAFRVVGYVKDKPGFSRVARAPVAEFETATAHLWLTVAPAAAKK